MEGSWELRFRGLASGAPLEKGKGSRVGCWRLALPRGWRHGKAGIAVLLKHLTKFV